MAGIVGVKKFAYDIWDDTVNIAARMEQHCGRGHVNVSAVSHESIKDHFTCSSQGMIEVKSKGLIEMYYVDGLKY